MEGQPRITADGARAIAAVSANDSTPLNFFDDRAEPYDALVEAAAHQTRDTAGIEVAFDEGSVENAVLGALMQPKNQSMEE